MGIYQYLFLLNFCTLYVFGQKGINFSYINNNDFSIKNAVYLIKNREGYLNLEFNDFAFFENKENKLNNYFLLINDNNNNREEWFYITYKLLGLNLSSSKNDNKIIKYSENLDKDYALWKIIPKINEENQLVYYIQNKKTKKYWSFENYKNNKELKLENVKKLNKCNEFQFVELYKEFEPKESVLLEKEPIDILFFFGQNIQKNEISKQKEKYNEQMKNIIENIPWIRKIFILMPNNIIKYFKPIKEEKEIIFIKDKDLLSLNSISFNSLGYFLSKMKNLGLSENFILIEDKYFVNRPLNKSNFFYEENNTILPLLIANDYYEIKKEQIQAKLYKYYLNKNNNKHSEILFNLTQKKTLLFMNIIFGDDNIRYGKKLVQPKNDHNPIPVNMGEIEEIFNYINSNKTLISLSTSKYGFDIQTFYIVYIKNKYDRKVSKISSCFDNLGDSQKMKATSEKINSINKSNIKKNTKINIKEKRNLNELYHKKRKEYKVKFINKDIKKKYNHIPLINFNEIKDINENILNKVKKMNKDILFLFNEINSLIDKMENIVNKTLIYNNETIKKDTLLNEIEYLKEKYKWQNSINTYIICLIILLIFNKIFIYYITIYNKQNVYSFRKGKRKKGKYQYKLFDYDNL